MLCCIGFFQPCLAAEVTPLEEYREVSRLWMGMEDGIIRPASYEQFRVDSECRLVLHAKDGQVLEKGDHWATVDPEQLQIERRTYELEKIKQEQQRLKSAEDAREARVRAGLDLHEAEGKRANLEAVTQDSDISPALKRRAAEALTKLDEQIAALRVKLEPAALEKELKLLDEECELNIERKRQQMELLERRSKLVAESAGKLRLGDSVKTRIGNGGMDEPVWIKAGEIIGTVVDDGHYEISITAEGPLLMEIPQDQLLVFLQDSQSGALIAGEYARTEETDNGREISRNMIFTIAGKDSPAARLAQGTRNLVHVYRKFPRPYRMVYKKDIAFLAPEVLEISGWDGLVRHLWPGSKVVQVGPQTIAVEPTNAN